jgi:HSP20 family protein
MAEQKPPALTPFPEMHQEVRRRFRELIHQAWGGQNAPAASGWQPCCDVAETDDAIIVEIELPGARREDVQISVEDDTLRITGERRATQQHRSRGYYQVERQYGQFTRQLRLPHTVDQTAIQAEFADGVLTITLPKHRNH